MKGEPKMEDSKSGKSDKIWARGVKAAQQTFNLFEKVRFLSGPFTNDRLIFEYNKFGKIG